MSERRFKEGESRLNERQRSLKTYSLNRTHDKSYIGLEEWERVKYREDKIKDNLSDADEELVESSIEDMEALKRKQEERRRLNKITVQEESVTSA